MRSTIQLIKKEENTFKCNRCGACCKNRDVPLTLDDIFRLSEFLGLDPDTFMAEHAFEKADGNGLVLPYLRQHADGCSFLEDNICKIHFVKPAACEHLPSTLFGGVEQLRSKMPSSCAIQQTKPEAVSNERLRRNYVTSTMLTTIYYSKFGEFKFETARPFIYRILLCKQNRDEIYRLVNSSASGN